MQPSGSGDFEASAVAWLLSVLSYDYRERPAVPVALAAMARYHSEAVVEGVRRCGGGEMLYLPARAALQLRFGSGLLSRPTA